MLMEERNAKRVSMILSATKDWVIGKNGGLLYRISEDLKRFRKITTGNVVIMGANTYFDCVGRELPNRVNYVLTHNVVNSVTEEVTDVENAALFFSPSLEEAIKHAKKHYPDKEIFIIGGGSVYNYSIENGLVDGKVYLTLIDKTVLNETSAEDEYTKIEPLFRRFKILELSQTYRDRENKIGYSFLTLDRR